MIDLIEKLFKEEILGMIKSFLVTYGPWGLLLALITLIVVDPDRIDKFRANILKPIYSTFGLLSSQYIAAAVSSRATELIKQNLGRILPSATGIKIVVKWVSSSSDPVLKEDGTVILRLEENVDQTRNILVATKASFQKIMCPTIRHNVQKSVFEAIDLALLKRLSEDMGNHALPVFQEYFLKPEIAKDPNVSEKFKQLVEIDNNGYLVSIFLRELDTLGARLYLHGDLSEKTNEVIRFIEFLQNIANREVGGEVELVYLSSEIKVAIILLAQSWKAETEGLNPYIRRINTNLAKGCDSIYIVAFKPAFKFFDKVIEAADAMPRLIINSTSKIRVLNKEEGRRDDYIRIGQLDRVKVGTSDIFAAAIQSAKIADGQRVEGEVLDVAINHAIIDVRGVLGLLSKEEASWITCDDCRRRFKEKQKIDVLVKEIDLDKELVVLSKKFDEEDPWLRGIPNVDDVIKVEFYGKKSGGLVGLFDERVEIYVPIDEIDWSLVGSGFEKSYLGKSYNVKIVNIDEDSHTITASIKKIIKDPWENIKTELAKGTKLRGPIRSITNQGIVIDIGNGLMGTVPKRSLQIAGYEFADYESTFVVGQSLDVVIYKVNTKKRFITLDLQRNIES